MPVDGYLPNAEKTVPRNSSARQQPLSNKSTIRTESSVRNSKYFIIINEMSKHVEPHPVKQVFIETCREHVLGWDNTQAVYRLLHQDGAKENYDTYPQFFKVCALRIKYNAAIINKSKYYK